MKKSLKYNFNKVIKPHTQLHEVIKSGLTYLGVARQHLYTNSKYRLWVRDIEPNSFLDPITDEYKSGSPLISLVIPFWNTPDKYLLPLIDSLKEQTYKNWELIAVDVSDDKDRAARIKNITSDDTRLHYLKLDRNYDIATNTNHGIERAKGRYIAFMDHDDTLSIHALNEIARAIANHDPDIIYTDEDKITDDGKVRHSPYFKPDWSPHLFLFTNYTNHLSVIKKDLIDEAGGLCKEYNGSQDYELLLRIHSLSSKQLSVHHIPKILYHWREASNSTASDHSKKSYAYLAGLRALESYFIRKKISAQTSAIEDYPGYYKQVFLPNKDTEVTVSINIPYMTESQRSIFAEGLKTRIRTSLKVDYDLTGNATDSENIIVEIQKECMPESETWLDELVGVCVLDDVETVSPRILDPSGEKIVETGKVKEHPTFELFNDYSGLRENDHTPTGATWWVRDVINESSWVTVRNTKSKDTQTRRYHVVWSHVDFRAVEN